MEEGAGKKPRRHFDKQFKLDAVRLIEEGGRTVAQIFRDLGVGQTQLRRWRELYGTGGATKKDGQVKASPDPEMERLRRELAQVKEEREILEFILKVVHVIFFSRRVIFTV